MKGVIILRGDLDSKRQYISSYITDNNIPDYYITRYEDSLKIAEAKQIIASLSQKIEQSKVRLFIIESSPTIEAQNSLLKTIEEIDDNSTMIFLDSNLLPTIYSRSHVIDLGSSEASIYKEEKELDNNYILLIDKIFSEKSDDPFGDIILLLRSSMLNAVKKRNKKLANVFYNLIKDFVDLYPLVRSNNLNPRLLSERIILMNQG